MASPPTPTPTILSCGDSPLSTTASVVGILTFALGLAASYIALQSATRGAPSEISRLIDDLRTTQREINRVAEYIFDDAHDTVDTHHRMFFDHSSQYVVSSNRVPTAAPVRRMGTMQALYDEVQELLGNCVRLFYEADDLLKRCESDGARWDPEGLRRRITFVMNRHEVAEKMQRLEDQKARLGDVRMSLFLKKSAMQDTMLKEIKETINGLMLRYKGEQNPSDDSGDHAP